MYKKYVAILAGALCLALMSGCVGRQGGDPSMDSTEGMQYFPFVLNYPKETLSQEQEAALPICSTVDKCIDYVKQTIPYDELSELLESKPTLEELNARIPLEFVRKLETSYKAVVKTDQGWVQVFFEQDGTFFDSVEMGELKGVLKDDLLRIPIGVSVKQVQKIDPDGDYDFMFTSWSGYPQTSHHYTSDGYAFSIDYNDAYEVVGISYCLI